MEGNPENINSLMKNQGKPEDEKIFKLRDQKSGIEEGIRLNELEMDLQEQLKDIEPLAIELGIKKEGEIPDLPFSRKDEFPQAEANKQKSIKEYQIRLRKIQETREKIKHFGGYIDKEEKPTGPESSLTLGSLN